MKLEIKELSKKDYNKVIEYAISGMNFNTYIDNQFILKLYARYFWYLELINSTQVIACYYGCELAGVLVADVNGETKTHKSFLKKLYVKLFEFIQKKLFKESVIIYNNVNKEMLNKYKQNNKPDGEIRFLTANPYLKIKGIGTFLLKELEKREKGKELYLFTDDKCTYQFYEHRGFDKVGEEKIILNIGKKTPLKCFLYRKKIK